MGCLQNSTLLKILSEGVGHSPLKTSLEMTTISTTNKIVFKNGVSSLGDDDLLDHVNAQLENVSTICHCHCSFRP